MERIEIHLNKKRLVLYLVFCVAIVITGVLFIANPAEFQTNWASPGAVLVAGIACILSFGTFGFIFINKLLSKKVGLLLDNEGIIDNASSNSVGLIEWQDGQLTPQLGHCV